MALIDVDYFNQQPLGLKGFDIQTDVLQEIIQEASDYVEDYIDRKIEIANYSERIVGRDRYTLILENLPVVSLNSVAYDGYPGDMGTYSTTEFLVHSNAGLIEWINKMYNFRSDRVYTVGYTAGYAEVPGPIKRAVALQTIQLLRPMYGGPSNNLPELVPFADDMIVNLLEKYRRKRIS